MKIACPYCESLTDPGAAVPPRLRCRSCHRIVSVPQGSRAEVMRGEPASPHAVLLVRPSDPAWVMETGWVRILKKRAVGLTWGAIEQAWDAYAALRKPAPVAAEFGTVNPLDGPSASLCILCEVTKRCPRCQPGSDFLDRRRALYREAGPRAPLELGALALAGGELAEARIHAGHPEEPDLLAAATALLCGQPRRALELAPADRLGPWLRARALLSAGRYAEAVNLFEGFEGPVARYLEACGRAAAGERDRARTMLEAVVSSDAPATLRWRAAVSVYLMDRKDPRALAKSRPRDPLASILLARAFLVTNQVPLAVECLPSDPPHPDVLLWRGHLLALARRPEDALATYERVLELAPGHEEALVALAYNALKCGQPQRALAVEAPPAEAGPNVRFDYLQALCRLKAGRAGEAIPQLVNVSRRTNDAAVQKTIALLQRQRGAALFAHGRYHEAIGIWKTAGGTEDPLVRGRIAEAYLRLGVDAMRKKNDEEATRALEAAVNLRGSAADSYYAGLVALSGGRLDAARPLFERAEADFKFALRSRVHRALALFMGRQNDEASKLALALPAAASDREKVLSGWTRAMAHVAAKEHEPALGLVREIHESAAAAHLFPSAVSTVKKLRRRLAKSQGDELDSVDSTAGGSPDLLSSTFPTALFSAVGAFAAGRPADARNMLRDAARKGDGSSAEARGMLETLYGLWTLKLIGEGKVEEASRLCAEASREPGVEGDWERWALAVRLDGRLKPAGPWDQPQARAAVRELESLMPEVAKSPRAAELMPVLRQALAVLSHKLAIDLEETGKAGEADGYWVRAMNAWLYLYGTGELAGRIKALARVQFGEVDEAEAKDALSELLRLEVVSTLLKYREHYDRNRQLDRGAFFGRMLESPLLWIRQNEPDDSRAGFELGMIYYGLSASELGAERFDACSGLLARAAELVPEHELIFRAVAIAHAQWAMHEMSRQNMALAAELVEIAAAADPYHDGAVRLREQLASFRRPEYSRSADILRYRKARDRIRWYSLSSDSFGEDCWRAVADMIRRGMSTGEIVERLMAHSGFEGADPTKITQLVEDQRRGQRQGGR